VIRQFTCVIGQKRKKHRKQPTRDRLVKMDGLENGAPSYSLTRCCCFVHPHVRTPSRWSPPPSMQRREREEEESSGRGRKKGRQEMVAAAAILLGLGVAGRWRRLLQLLGAAGRWIGEAWPIFFLSPSSLYFFPFLSYCRPLFSCYGSKTFNPFKLRLNMCRPV
jgi:hypothetical protein